jgi:hypothetical protein
VGLLWEFRKEVSMRNFYEKISTRLARQEKIFWVPFSDFKKEILNRLAPLGRSPCVRKMGPLFEKGSGVPRQKFHEKFLLVQQSIS